MKTAVLSPEIARPRGHYSQAVHVGPLLFISGQLPLDPEGEVIGDSVGAQAYQALENVRAVLTAAGASLDALAQVVIYISDIREWAEVNSVYEGFLKDVSVPPARSIVPVNELHYGAKIEIQAIAYVAH